MDDSVVNYDRMSNLELLATLHTILGEAVNLPAANLTEIGLAPDDASFFADEFWEEVKGAYETLAHIAREDMPQAQQIYDLLAGRERLFYGSLVEE